MTEQQTIRAVPTPAPEPAAPSDFDDPKLYDNRELSWLSFNQRVLELAEQSDEPLLERLNYSSIVTSNLDEFFMIRVAGLHDQVDAGLSDPGADGRTPSQVIDELRVRIVDLSERQTRCFERDGFRARLTFAAGERPDPVTERSQNGNAGSRRATVESRAASR